MASNTRRCQRNRKLEERNEKEREKTEKEKKIKRYKIQKRKNKRRKRKEIEKERRNNEYKACYRIIFLESKLLLEKDLYYVSFSFFYIKLS